MMDFHDVVPQCKVNLDYGKCFDCSNMERQGVLNIPYEEGAVNLAANLLGMMCDTITVVDDGHGSVDERINHAQKIAPLAKRILILKKEGDGYRVVSVCRQNAYVVCADRSQRQREVYVC